MKIRYADLRPHTGGLVKLDLVVEGDISAISDEISKIKKSPEKWGVEFKRIDKRSLTANRYAWKLIEKLAVVLHTDKLTVYREIVRDMAGISRMVCVQNKDKDALIRDWCSNGIGWQAEEYPSKLEGCTDVILYKGSSAFNSSEMNRFIELIQMECKAQGIEIMTPKELNEISYTD